MIAATYTQNDAFRIEDLPVPDIAADELLVKVMASSICGTDVRIIRNGHRKLAPKQKLVLGHEFAGIVVKVGKQQASFHEGQRIGVAPNIGCGQCDMCVRGLPNMCPDYTAFGITFDGAHTEYVRIPAAAITQGSVHRLPDGLSFSSASLIEPLSCVVNGNRAARIEMGDTVVIFGAGPIGLMHVMLARLSGAAKVIVVDVQPQRLVQAAEVGATSVVNSVVENAREHVFSETTGRGANAVITACSASSVQEQSLDLSAPLGRVCFFGGLPKDGSLVRLDTNIVHYKQLELTGVTGGSPRDFRIALNLIASGRIDIQKVISHRFVTPDLAKAFDVAVHGECMKIVLCQEETATP
jgi:threonine dehydrogenase-like Zn-dependent dehydrogenase